MNGQIDKYNQYGIKKDFECKTCFNEMYRNEIVDYVMSGGAIGRCKEKSEDWVRIDMKPACSKCGSHDIKPIPHTFINGSLEGALSGEETFEFGMSVACTSIFKFEVININ